MTTEFLQPKRGDVWRVNFDPAVGAEIQKTRPAIVVSSDEVGRLPIKLVAPITNWNDAFARNIWHVQITPDETNGLTKTSAIDVLQMHGLDTRRFVERLGIVSDAIMDEITMAIAAVIEFEPQTIP